MIDYGKRNIIGRVLEDNKIFTSIPGSSETTDENGVKIIWFRLVKALSNEERARLEYECAVALNKHYPSEKYEVKILPP